MSKKLEVGKEVSWDWGNGSAKGTIQEIHCSDISRTIKGNDVTRHGSEENPAVVLEQEDGTSVLKLKSELNL